MISAKPEQAAPDIDRLFPTGFEEQRAAAKVALSQGLTVLTGGPGTGKTTTVARLLALLADGARLADRVGGADRQGGGPAAGSGATGSRQTGKPADREALAGLHATTLHRLLGSRPDTSARFRHHRGNRLPHDVIVVDEASMVSLTMMARLLEAVRPEARLSWSAIRTSWRRWRRVRCWRIWSTGLDEAKIAALKTPHRFGESIGELATAIRVGDADRVVEVLRAGGEHIEWIEAAEPPEQLRNVACAPCACR